MLCALCLPTLSAGSELTPPPTLWPLLPPAGPALAPHPAPPARPLRRTALRTFQSVPCCVPEQFKRVCKISRQGPHLMSPLMGTSVSGWPPLPRKLRPPGPPPRGPRPPYPPSLSESKLRNGRGTVRMPMPWLVRNWPGGPPPPLPRPGPPGPPGPLRPGPPWPGGPLREGPPWPPGPLR